MFAMKLGQSETVANALVKVAASEIAAAGVAHTNWRWANEVANTVILADDVTEASIADSIRRRMMFFDMPCSDVPRMARDVFAAYSRVSK
jgi:hypothetical protein